MSRFYPAGSTEVHRIPAYAGMPNGGDLVSLFYRAYLLDDSTAPFNNRHITRREGANPNAWSAQMGNAANALRWIAGFSTTAGAWEMSAAWAPNRWHDILIVHDTSSTATVPTLYVDGAAAALTTITTPVGTPSVSLADVYLGNRAAGAAPMWGALAEIAWWKGRLLTPRDVRLLTAYGPESSPRSRTGWWSLDKFGKNASGYVQSHDGPNPILYSAGSGGVGYTPAPPKRKRRWFSVPYVRPPAAAFTLTPATGVYVVSGRPAPLAVARTLGPARGAYAITGTTAPTVRGLRVTPATGGYTLTGTATALRRGLRVVPAPGSYAITGSAAALERALRLAPTSGTYSISGTSAALTRGLRVIPATGLYVLTGTAATLTRTGAQVLAAATGAYVVTGRAATLTVARTLAPQPGTYALAGTAAQLTRALRLLPATSTYTVTGVAAATLRGLRLSPPPGSYTVTGAIAMTRLARVLAVVTGAIAVLGRALTFLRPGGAHAIQCTLVHAVPLVTVTRIQAHPRVTVTRIEAVAPVRVTRVAAHATVTVARTTAVPLVRARRVQAVPL